MLEGCGTEPATLNTTSTGGTKADMKLVRAFAVRDGRGDSDAAAFRVAIVELAKRIRREAEDDREAT